VRRRPRGPSARARRTAHRSIGHTTERAALARTLKLDDNAFRSCLGSGKFKSSIEADIAQGQKLGVAGTPGFFVNGVFLSGAQPIGEFEKIIDTQLALSKAAHSQD